VYSCLNPTFRGCPGPPAHPDPIPFKYSNIRFMAAREREIPCWKEDGQAACVVHYNGVLGFIQWNPWYF
jgi:hypothetical protein